MSESSAPFAFVSYADLMCDKVEGTYIGGLMPDNKKPNVDAWVETEQKDPHKVKALKNASRHFDENDQFTVHTLEAIYGRESSFGTDRGQRGINGPAGDFQLRKPTAERMGLTVTKENDERFDVDQSSDASARYLKTLDRIFSKETTLSPDRKSTPVVDPHKRKTFVLAAYNAGEGRIAQTQIEAIKGGADPTEWNQVKEYLEPAGATLKKVEEIINYIKKVFEYEKEFEEKSPVKGQKELEPKEIKRGTGPGRWVTIDARPVFIED